MKALVKKSFPVQKFQIESASTSSKIGDMVYLPTDASWLSITSTVFLS